MELSYHFLVWGTSVLYALFSFCQSANETKKLLDPQDFKEGWTILEHKKDVSDIEWGVFTYAFKKYWIYLFVQVLCTQVLLPKTNKKICLLFYTIYSICCLIIIIGPMMTAVYILYILLVCAIHSTGSKSLCYGVTMLSLYSFQQEKFTGIRERFVSEDTEGFLVDVGLIWLAARALSFALDRIESRSHLQFRNWEIFQIFTYCLYLPVVFSGPLLNYQAFIDQVNKNKKRWTSPSFLKAMLFLYKPIYGYFLLELLLHFVYASSIQYYPDLLLQFDAWSLCGLGYALPILFYLKYFVIYGMSGTIAKLEHVEFPPPPKCISRTHLPSVLWRTFDRGLYLWILKYLYLPIKKRSGRFARRLSALAICFLFIALWHGRDETVCTWATLNFIGVTVEITLTLLSSSSICITCKKYLSVQSRRNLSALVSTPQFMLMCISSICFLSNLQIGLMVFKRIVLGDIIPFLPVVFIMYCGCHVSLSIKEWDDKKLLKNMKKI